jgi:hypothetical protein
MLRPVTANYLAPRLVGYAVDNSSGTSSVSAGNTDDVYSVASSSGVITVVPKDPFARSPIIVSSSETLGSMIASLDSETDHNTFTATCKTHAGAALNTKTNSLVLGYDVGFTDLFNKSRVVAANLKPRIIATTINTLTEADPLYGCPRDFAVTYASSVATVTFPNPFARTPIVIATISGTGCASANVSNVTNQGCTISTTDAAGSASGAAVHLLVLGWDIAHSVGAKRRPVQISQREARLIGLCANGATQDIIIGGNDASGVNATTGRFNITYSKAMRRTPIVVANASVTTTPLYVSVVTTTTALSVYSFDKDGKAADFDNLNVIILGFDDPTTY